MKKESYAAVARFTQARKNARGFNYRLPSLLYFPPILGDLDRALEREFLIYP